MCIFLNLSSLHTNTDAFANSAEPDEMAYNESSHQDLHCLPILLLIFDRNPYRCVQSQRQKRPFQKIKGEKVKEKIHMKYLIFM